MRGRRGYIFNRRYNLFLIYLGAKGNYYLEIYKDTYDTVWVPYIIIGPSYNHFDHDMSVRGIQAPINEGEYDFRFYT